MKNIITISLLVLVVFVVGIAVGNLWGQNGKDISKTLKQSELDAESFLVEQELFESFETKCPLAEKRLSELSRELWRLGKPLEAPESEKDEGYNFLKRKYHLMQIRTYTLYKKLEKDCNSRTNMVLFYYKKNDDKSEKVGKLLDSMVEQYGIRVLATEYNYSKELEFLEDYYEVTDAPTIVVNFNHILTGETTKEQVVQLLNG